MDPWPVRSPHKLLYLEKCLHFLNIGFLLCEGICMPVFNFNSTCVQTEVSGWMLVILWFKVQLMSLLIGKCCTRQTGCFCVHMHDSPPKHFF